MIYYLNIKGIARVLLFNKGGEKNHSFKFENNKERYDWNRHLQSRKCFTGIG